MNNFLKNLNQRQNFRELALFINYNQLFTRFYQKVIKLFEIQGQKLKLKQ